MSIQSRATNFLPLTGSMRARIEATIESLTALLDEIDGDPDFEPDSDDEPCLGVNVDGGWNDSQGGGDREEDEDPGEDDGILEDDDADEDDDPAEYDFRDFPVCILSRSAAPSPSIP